RRYTHPEPVPRRGPRLARQQRAGGAIAPTRAAWPRDPRRRLQRLRFREQRCVAPRAGAACGDRGRHRGGVARRAARAAPLTRLPRIALPLLFVAVAVAVRLPHLLGGHVALDGDESIVGLMARDLLEGRRVPVFFYGQRYGLALFEVAPLAAAFRLFG